MAQNTEIGESDRLSQDRWVVPSVAVVGVKDDLAEIPRLTSLARFA
jgi:hypothetical protein